MAGLSQVHPVGALWSYCNAGFYLAGRVIEVVTGTSYEEALQQWVLDALAVRDATFAPERRRGGRNNFV